MTRAAQFDVDFTAKQSEAIRSIATEILYGGAAGGGKSYFMRALAIILCGLIPGLNVFLFRRIRDDLIKNHMEGINGFPVMLAGLVQSGHVKIVEDEIRFWNGSKIFLCHCEHEKHRFKYQGAEIHVLLIDELTMFTEVIYRFLRSRMRAPEIQFPEWAVEFFKAKFGVHLPAKIPLILCGSNPGNVGHLWVKRTWIDKLLPMETKRMPNTDGGMIRQYIPALLEDNPHVDAVEYTGKLEGLGSAELVKAYRFAIWDIVVGAFFDNIRQDKHRVKPFTPPKHWTRFRSFDWGSAKPFSVGWWCLAEGDWVTLSDGTERQFPRGALIRYREWYGCKVDENGEQVPNVGLKLDAEVVARGIKQREAGETITESGSPADPSLWKEDGGPSIAERMLKAAGIRFMPADNERVTGWQQVRARLNGDDEPMMYWTENCRALDRTLPALQHDEHKPEDVDSKQEDHAPDDARYMCQARPYSRVKAPKPSGPAPWTIDWIIQQDEARKAGRI